MHCLSVYFTNKEDRPVKSTFIDVPDYVHNDERLKKRPLKRIEIVIPEYAKEYGVWPITGGPYVLEVHLDPKGTVVISGDKEGLITLARHLLTLAQDEVPLGAHIHYDDNLLEENSLDLVVGRM